MADVRGRRQRRLRQRRTSIERAQSGRWSDLQTCLFPPPFGHLPPHTMSEYLCFEVELNAQPVAVIVSDTTLRASFALDGAPNDLNHLYTSHRSAIHDAAARRASSSPHRHVVLRAGDLAQQCAAGHGRHGAGSESGSPSDSPPGISG